MVLARVVSVCVSGLGGGGGGGWGRGGTRPERIGKDCI